MKNILLTIRKTYIDVSNKLQKIFFFPSISQNPNLGYGQSEWCAGSSEDSTTNSTLNRLVPNIPMPTLYSSESNRKPKISMTDLVLYNMASMLACVATGYDVRMSNVSPVHPHLQPPNDDFSVSSSAENELLTQERGGYGHNTYHGPVKHTRCVINRIQLSQNIFEF